jgi:hypothetical protein
MENTSEKNPQIELDCASNRTILELVGIAVGQFLSENGGVDGYMTFVEGTIQPNTIGGIIKFLTPTSDELTGMQMKGKCKALETQIKKILSSNNVEKTITLQTKFENGKYIQSISVIDSLQITIPVEPTGKVFFY